MDSKDLTQILYIHYIIYYIHKQLGLSTFKKETKTMSPVRVKSMVGIVVLLISL